MSYPLLSLQALGVSCNLHQTRKLGWLAFVGGPITCQLAYFSCNWFASFGVLWDPLSGYIGAKNCKKPEKTDFHEDHVFESFLMVLRSFRGARTLLNTIRTHLDTAGAGLTFLNNEITQYSCFGECQCTGNDPQNLPFCPGTPQNTFIFLRYFKTTIL